MCTNAEKGNPDAETVDWNTLYNTVYSKDDPDVKEWNDNYSPKPVPPVPPTPVDPTVIVGNRIVLGSNETINGRTIKLGNTVSINNNVIKF